MQVGCGRGDVEEHLEALALRDAAHPQHAGRRRARGPRRGARSGGRARHGNHHGVEPEIGAQHVLLDACLGDQAIRVPDPYSVEQAPAKRPRPHEPRVESVLCAVENTNFRFALRHQRRPVPSRTPPRCGSRPPRPPGETRAAGSSSGGGRSARRAAPSSSRQTLITRTPSIRVSSAAWPSSQVTMLDLVPAHRQPAGHQGLLPLDPSLVAAAPHPPSRRTPSGRRNRSSRRRSPGGGPARNRLWYLHRPRMVPQVRAHGQDWAFW